MQWPGSIPIDLDIMVLCSAMLCLCTLSTQRSTHRIAAFGAERRTISCSVMTINIGGTSVSRTYQGVSSHHAVIDASAGSEGALCNNSSEVFTHKRV